METGDEHIAKVMEAQSQHINEHNLDDEENWKCKKCGAECRIGDSNLFTCSNPQCGLTSSKALDQSAEWRHRSEGSDDPARCGMPINPFLKESSYGCRLVGATKSVQMRKLGKYTNWQSMPYNEKALHDGFEHIRRASVRAGIPKRLIEEAYRIHKDISEERSFRGINREGITAAALYLSCRLNGCPRTAKEIAQMFNLDPTHTTRGCKNAMSVLSMIERERGQGVNETKFPKMQCSQFVDRFACRSGLSDELTAMARFIALKVDRDKLVQENAPNAVASGIVWYVCQMTKQNISKKTVAQACEISEVTISKCHKKLLARQEKFLPPTIAARYGVEVRSIVEASA